MLFLLRALSHHLLPDWKPSDVFSSLSPLDILLIWWTCCFPNAAHFDLFGGWGWSLQWRDGFGRGQELAISLHALLSASLASIRGAGGANGGIQLAYDWFWSSFAVHVVPKQSLVKSSLLHAPSTLCWLLIKHLHSFFVQTGAPYFQISHTGKHLK